MTEVWDYTDPRVVDGLSDWQIQEWAEALQPKWSKYIPKWVIPTPQQRAFMLLDCKEGLFGGAAGGGKSTCLLMAALQYADVPGYAALLLRRTYADLAKPGALLPKSHEWLRNTDAHWDGMNKQWRFPSGAVLDFGYLDGDKDIYKYQSSEYQFIGFDELTQFMELWYRYLFSRLRGNTTLMSHYAVPWRMRSGSNPGGEGHDWVRRRFLIEGPGAGRVFVPAKLEDNPHLDRESYEESLSNLDPTTYQQLRHGDWDTLPPGDMFRREAIEIVESAPAGLKWIRSWDLAGTKGKKSAYTAGTLMALQHGIFYVGHVARIKGDPGEVESLIAQTAATDGRSVEVWMEQEPGSGGVNTIWNYRRRVLVGYTLNPYHPKGDKVQRAKPLANASNAGNMKIVQGERGGRWVNDFIDECHAFPGGFKDQVDSASQGMDVLTSMLKPEPRVRFIRERS